MDRRICQSLFLWVVPARAEVPRGKVFSFLTVSRAPFPAPLLSFPAVALEAGFGFGGMKSSSTGGVSTSSIPTVERSFVAIVHFRGPPSGGWVSVDYMMGEMVPPGPDFCFSWHDRYALWPTLFDFLPGALLLPGYPGLSFVELSFSVSRPRWFLPPFPGGARDH